MTRRGGRPGRAVKKTSRKATKSREAPQIARTSTDSTATIDELREQLWFRTRELTEAQKHLTEALSQQTATAEILSVISNSVADTQPVFNVIVQSGLKLFPNALIGVALSDGKMVRAAAVIDPDPARAEAWRRRFPFPLTREYMHGLAILDGKVVDLPDVENAPEEFAPGKRNLLVTGYRAVTIMPMMRGNEAIGALTLARLALGPLTAKQLSILSTFAAQAMIAIENARLFNELRQRTDDLTESLEQQTATAEVLSVMSRSKFDLARVLQSVVDTAARLCRADQAVIFRLEDGLYRFAAGYSLHPEYLEIERANPITAGPGTMVGRAAMTRHVAQIDDAMADPGYEVKEQAAIAHLRSIIGVPLLRDNEPMGVIALARCRVEPFSDREIDLVTTFADQAVIAIENVRLFDEIQDKSRQLEEASKHKSQFLANMSHELRTPLNAILGYTELITDGVYGQPPDKMLAVLKRLESNGRHLFGLINDVLDLSKIEAGQLTLSIDNYSMKDVVHSVYGAVEPLAAEKKIALKIELTPDLPSGRGDERVLVGHAVGPMKCALSGEHLEIGCSSDV